MLSEEIQKLREKFDYLKKKQGRDETSLLIYGRDIKLLSEFYVHPLCERMLAVILQSVGRDEVDFDGFVKVKLAEVYF